MKNSCRMRYVLAGMILMVFVITGCGNNGYAGDSNEDQPELSRVETVEQSAEKLEGIAALDDVAILRAFTDDFESSGSVDDLEDIVRQHGLFADSRLDGIGNRWYKIACSKEEADVISISDMEKPGNYVCVIVNLIGEDKVKSVVLHTIDESTKPSGDHYDETMKGRGISDAGRDEPDYVDVIGYAVVGYDEERTIEKSDTFQDESLWIVPTFELEKQSWVENGSIPHKTEVVVREQYLKHEGYGSYSGYLFVETTEDGSQYYIDVKNYVTKPYWTYSTDLQTAALTGDFVAEYTQVSDHYPVNSSGEAVEIEDGMIVLVTGITGVSGWIDREENDIEALVWKEWRNGYGGVECYFSSKDLSVVY